GDRVVAIAVAAHEVRARDIMRKTITGTGGMLLLQTLKDAGVDYLFTNPGSAETGIFAAIAEDGDQRLVVGKHEGLVAAMADGYHRLSGKVGVVMAHVMGGSYQLAGQPFNAQGAGASLPVYPATWASSRTGHPCLSRFPGLSQAESMRPITKDARAAYNVHANPAAITVATTRALREAVTPPTGPVYLSISAELLNREGLEAQIGEGAQYQIERPGPARAQTVEAIAHRLGAGPCPGLLVGRARVGGAGRGSGGGGAAGRAAGGARLREPADLRELPLAPPALLRHVSRVQGLREGLGAQARPAFPRGLPGRARSRHRAHGNADRPEP